MNDEDEEIQSRTPSPVSSPLNGRISVPVAPPPLASPPPRPLSSSPPPHPLPPPASDSLALALPAPQPRASNGGGGSGGGGGGGGGREDCWSETATEALIDAWGERYLESSRGNLKQKHWQEVADLVTSRGGYSKVPKSDVQCKNRIDTVKKKYKVEKAKIAAGGVSNWPLFDKLDGLIGPTGKSPLPSANKAAGGTSLAGKKKKRKRKVESDDDDDEDDEDEDLGFDSDDGLPPPHKALPAVNRADVGNVEKGRDRSAVRVLTEAMLKFGEAYERAETAKLAQVVEMEKARMRFAKEVELQRMQFFMKTQMEISQLKKRSSGSGGGGGGVTGSKHKQQPQQRRYHFHHHHRERLDGNNVVVDKNASDNDV